MHEIHMDEKKKGSLDEYRIMNRTDLEIESFENDLNIFYQKHFITYTKPDEKKPVNLNLIIPGWQQGKELYRLVCHFRGGKG